MNKLYKRLALLIGLVGAISAAVIYLTVDVDTLRHLDSFKPWSIVAALICLAVGMYFDGTRLTGLAKISGERLSLGQAVQVIFGNYFLALLTPGATGGAVAQLLFLRQAGLPTGKATVIVLVRTILSILFLLVCMPIVFYLDPGLVPWISTKTLATASGIILILILGGIWLVRSNLIGRLLIIVMRRFRPSLRRRFYILYRDVRGAIFLLSAAPLGVVRVFLESGLSLLALYSIVPTLFLGLGINIDWSVILGRMIFLNFLLYFAPTPGGSGIAEGGFVMLFNEFLPPGTVGILAVAWRIIAEYLPFLFGMYFTVKVFGESFLTHQEK